ncbi:MAG: glycosyltransferase, partial [Sphingopyxis sp.]
MRICIVYDCLFPWTVGGAERWYRGLAEAYAAAGHQVTYLTMRQWAHDDPPVLAGVEVVAVAPRMALYDGEKRRTLPPLIFGLGVLLHLIRRGSRYDVVHGASFPFFSLLATGLIRPFAGYRIIVDWFEVWTKDYWRSYLGRLGVIGWTVQRLCAAVPQMAFSFSRLHAARAIALGVGGRNVELLEGLYAGPSLTKARPAAEPSEIVYAGRMIPEKQVPLLVEALAIIMTENADLRATLIGRGPEHDSVASRIAAHGLGERIALPGFVAEDALEDALCRAALIVQPSTREGYG